MAASRRSLYRLPSIERLTKIGGMVCLAKGTLECRLMVESGTQGMPDRPCQALHPPEWRPRSPRPRCGAAWNRGAYLVRHLGHCGECHTARNLLGARDAARELAGNLNGPNGKKVANITPHPKDGIGGWRAGDIAYYLKTGFLPDGDFAGGAMVEVIESTTSRLTDADRPAISVYLRSLPPTPGPSPDATIS